MPAYDLNQGENLLLQLHLLTMADGLEWKGVWSAITAYVVNDVVELDDIGYVCILNHTNQTPPNPTYWTVLPPIDADDIKNFNADLRESGGEGETEVVAVSWKYKSSSPPPSNIKVEDGLVQLELLAEDSKKLEGLYDLHFEIAVKDSLFIASGKQTDSVCLTEVIDVSPC